MATSFLQKIALAWRGWSRRRAEETKRRNEEFLAKSTSWGAGVPPAAPPPSSAATPAARTFEVDREGLQVAYLDDSGAIEHYLDVESGEVVEFSVASPLCDVANNPARYRKVPARSAQSDAEDRRTFADALDAGKMRDKLAAALDATEFRRVLATDRAIERAWYNFKNDRANAAIDAWLRSVMRR